ncbi:hypothetical protein HPB51_017824 [Rhipicephalus microplus]|uniref:Uncharacterized protein n=1 Tax=Rhipicephalus microplus TaxID=6941 RepID=A0A9J6DW75_RHIMP|nr:hypothetical protein HPB51_017824 [Rhipicephalus microplus]
MAAGMVASFEERWPRHRRPRISKLKMRRPSFCGPRLTPASRSQETSYLMSNHLTQVPNLTGCSELLILDLTYNRIKSLDESPFLSLKKLRDLNLGNNLIRRIGDAAFHGLTSLQVLNLADNAFPAMPYRGLRGLHRLVTSGNRHLRSFPPPEAFPRIQKLYLSYSYHCCAYLQSVGSGTPEAPVAKDAVLWLKKEDIDYGQVDQPQQFILVGCLSRWRMLSMYCQRDFEYQLGLVVFEYLFR